MAKKNETRQKRLGLILMASGTLVFAVVASALFWRTSGIAGFPELLPAEGTTVYVEFSFSQISPLVPIPYNIESWDWKKGDKGAIAYVGEPQLLPYLLLKTSSPEQTLESLKNYLNPQGVIEQSKAGEADIFVTPQFAFTFIEDTVLIAPSEESLQAFLAMSKTGAARLSKDPQFKKIWGKIDEGVSGFWRESALQSLAEALSEVIPEMPRFMALDAVSGTAHQTLNQKRLQGSVLAFPKSEIPLQQERGYRALLLPLLPKESDLVLAGQNLLGQIQKIDAMTASEKQLLSLSALLRYAAEQYLPDIDVTQTVEPLLSEEFALAVRSDAIIFITQLAHPADQERIAALRLAFSRVTSSLSPKSVSVTLPDGTQAFEFFPDPSHVRNVEETFRGVTIHGRLWEKDGVEQGIFDAVTKDKWFVSSSLEQLKHAITLTQEPGANFRESEMYRFFLQPILRNPELLGVAKLPDGKTFGFSKRTGSQRMETGFVYEW